MTEFSSNAVGSATPTVRNFHINPAPLWLQLKRTSNLKPSNIGQSGRTASSGTTRLRDRFAFRAPSQNLLASNGKKAGTGYYQSMTPEEIEALCEEKISQALNHYDQKSPSKKTTRLSPLQLGTKKALREVLGYSGVGAATAAGVGGLIGNILTRNNAGSIFAIFATPTGLIAAPLAAKLTNSPFKSSALGAGVGVGTGLLTNKLFGSSGGPELIAIQMTIGAAAGLMGHWIKDDDSRA